MGGGAAGVDVGGTKIAAGVVAADGQISPRARRDSPAGDGAAIIDAIVDAVADLGSAASGIPIGVGAAGIVDLDGVVRYSPNLAWTDVPLRAVLSERLERAVVVENDGNAAAWGEFRAGAAATAHASAVMVTVGTGVGGGIVLDGRLVRGADGLAGELGHIIVAEGGRRCNCGNAGCLESYASGTAIAVAAAEHRQRGDIPTGSPLDRDDVTGADVTRAGQGGDPAAQRVLAEIGGWLGVGLASLANALDPEVLVIGGGAVDADNLLLDPARHALRERLLGRAHRTVPPVVAAALGPDAGMIGAALLAR